MPAKNLVRMLRGLRKAAFAAFVCVSTSSVAVADESEIERLKAAIERAGEQANKDGLVRLWRERLAIERRLQKEHEAYIASAVLGALEQEMLLNEAARRDVEIANLEADLERFYAQALWESLSEDDRRAAVKHKLLDDRGPVKKKPPNKSSSLEGIWVKETLNGRPVDGEPKIVVDGPEWKDESILSKPIRMAVNLQSSPQQIDFEYPQLGIRKGIFKIEVDRLTICMAGFGQARPQEFEEVGRGRVVTTVYRSLFDASGRDEPSTEEHARPEEASASGKPGSQRSDTATAPAQAPQSAPQADDRSDGEPSRPTPLAKSWKGVYQYTRPSNRPAVNFEMELQHDVATGAIEGRIVEPDTLSGRNNAMLRASVVGSFDAKQRQISFRKQYDGSNRVNHSVMYQGEVAADGSKISGQWRLGSNRGVFELTPR